MCRISRALNIRIEEADITPAPPKAAAPQPHQTPSRSVDPYNTVQDLIKLIPLTI